MHQAIKNAFVAAVAVATTVTVMQVASANFLPPSVNDKELQQSHSAVWAPVMESLPITPGDLMPLAQESVSSDSSQLDDLTALMDMQTQTAFGFLQPTLESSGVEPLGKANNSVAGSPHLASLEQSQAGDMSDYLPDQGLAPTREGPRQLPRDKNQSPSRHHGSQISRIEFDAPALAPMSHTIFCLKYRNDCKVDTTVSVESRVTLTSERWAEIERINTAVNRAIIPHPNTKGLAGEVWLISPRAGECHDYAVTKRHELLSLGWPEQDLLLSEVVTSWGEHHLVLVIRTSDGDFVADNLNPNIRIWSQTPYQWVRIQSPGNPLIWSKLANNAIAARPRTRASGQGNPS